MQREKCFGLRDKSSYTFDFVPLFSLEDQCGSCMLFTRMFAVGEVPAKTEILLGFYYIDLYLALLARGGALFRDCQYERDLDFSIISVCVSRKH